MYLSKKKKFDILFGRLSKIAQSRKLSEQERGIFPSLPDTSTFGMNSPQMAQIRAKKTLNDPKSKERYPHHNRRPKLT